MTTQISALDQIKARRSAASSGPWEAKLVGYPGQPAEEREWVVDSEQTFICSTHIGTARGKDDAEFIAHAPEDISNLTGAVEAALRVADGLDGRVAQNLRNIEAGIYDEAMIAEARHINSLAAAAAEQIRSGIARALEGK